MNLRRSVPLAATIAVASMLAPAISSDQHKAAYGCSFMAIDPGSAINLRRPSALRYKAAPLRLCVREDTNYFRPVAAV
jgi:hypothetical protein